MKDGDCVLLCTDGLSSVVPHERIADTLAQRRRLGKPARRWSIPHWRRVGPTTSRSCSRINLIPKD